MKCKWHSVFEQLLFTFIVLGGRTRAYSGKTAPAYPQNKVNMFILNFESSCSVEYPLFDYKSTIGSAVYNLRNITLEDEPFINVGLHLVPVPGCNLKQDHHATQLMTLLYDLGYLVSSAAFEGFSIIIGPQSGSDCDLVMDWIRVSGIAAVTSDRIFQINFACRMFVFQMEFIVPNAVCKQ
ncbi:unnamed protein product [Dibothriocephalus latus]|uniref:Receptor ligand binding region domain-containing protein n=1 Tax=Dibothriocephalus latus TaxID=60516 RepID=A0A3P7P9H7_DIBLA|nr:unnamed protein product [Dibothriocephalus latus]